MSALTSNNSFGSNLASDQGVVTVVRRGAALEPLSKRPRFLYLTFALVGLIMLLVIAFSSWLLVFDTASIDPGSSSFWEYAIYWFLRGLTETAAALLVTMFLFSMLVRFWLPSATRASVESSPITRWLWALPFVLAAVIAFGPFALLFTDDGQLTREEWMSVAIELISAALVGAMLWVFLWLRVRKQVAQLPETAQMAVAAVAKIYAGEHASSAQRLTITLNLADQHLRPQSIVAEVGEQGVRVLNSTPRKLAADEQALASEPQASSEAIFALRSGKLFPVTVADVAPSEEVLRGATVIGAYQAEVAIALSSDLTPHPGASMMYDQGRGGSKAVQLPPKARRDCYELTVKKCQQGVFVVVEDLKAL